jgi:hypothetical protein
MDRFYYSNLTIVDEGEDIKQRTTQLQETIIARFPQHASYNISPQAIQAAAETQFGAFIKISDISRYETSFLLHIHSPSARRDMLTKGYLNMTPLSPNLIPWNPEYGSIATLAYPQLSAIHNFDYNTSARNLGKPLKQIQMKISGIPPHLCSHTTVDALLNKIATIR